MDYQFNVELKKLLEVEIQTLLNSLASGACADFPEYKYMCGRLLELQNVLEIADDLRKKMLGV